MSVVGSAAQRRPVVAHFEAALPRNPSRSRKAAGEAPLTEAEVAEERSRDELLGVWYGLVGTRFQAAGSKSMVPRELLMKAHTLSDGQREGRAQGRREAEIRERRKRCKTIPFLDLGDLPAEAEGLFLIDTPEALLRALDHHPRLPALASACESQ